MFVSKDCKDNVTALSKSTDWSSFARGMIFSDETFAQLVRNVSGNPVLDFTSVNFFEICKSAFIYI